MIKPKILLAEDNPNTGYLLRKHLLNEGFHCILATDGKVADEWMQKENFDLYLVDIMMPNKNGFEVSKSIKKKNPLAPVIFITASTSPDQIYKGFEHGADDYITKPFDLNELIFRIKAVLNRSYFQKQKDQELVKLSDKIVLDRTNRTLLSGEQKIPLTPVLSDLLHLFITNIDKTISRTDILCQVWGSESESASKSLDVYMTRLRKITEDMPGIEIESKYGLGYKMSYKKSRRESLKP